MPWIHKLGISLMTTYPNVQDERLQNPTSLPRYCFAQACLPRGGTWAKKVAVDHSCLGYVTVICRGWHFLPSDMGIIANDYKDPYWTTSMIWKVRVRVIFCSWLNCSRSILRMVSITIPESEAWVLSKTLSESRVLFSDLPAFTHRVPSSETRKGFKVESFSIMLNR